MTFPENIREREKYIYDSVLAGNFDARWVRLEHSAGGHHLVFDVMGDALKVDGVRVNVSATLAQQLADVFSASLPTALVADLMYAKAGFRLDPNPMPISTSVSSMLKHDSLINEKVQPRFNGLLSPVGKHWIIDRKLESSPGRACNYGWHFLGTTFKGIKGHPPASQVRQINGSPISVIQPNATAHDALHLDYSQICQLVSQVCWVDGVELRFSDLLIDPKLSHLVNHDGPLKIVRQPGVPEVSGIHVTFPVNIIV